MSAAARLRREGPSVHHVLCDLRRPPAGPLKCTCGVPDLAAKLADLLDAVHPDQPFDSAAEMERWAIHVQERAHALDAAIDRSGT